MPDNLKDPLADCLERLKAAQFSPFELLTSRNLAEKLIELVLQGAPLGPAWLRGGFKALTAALAAKDTAQAKVVVFGGGTGLSTIIGGDSRSLSWVEHPFQGLKAIFPKTTAIVCTTDDGGSTGELLKDLPLIGLGDLRHVLLSSIQQSRLLADYGLPATAASQVVAALFAIFNHRFARPPASPDDLLTRGGLNLRGLPRAMAAGITTLTQRLFSDQRLAVALKRPHCLGNLLLAAAIYGHTPPGESAPGPEAIRDGLREVAALIGVAPDAVLPCTCTPSVLKVRYSNGVVAAGESKSAAARRGVPIEQVLVDFAAAPPQAPPEVMAAIREADIILFAPGSLYTSIAPIMQVPGLSQAVRDNLHAMKLLVANLWVQAGETDLAIDDPGRRFYVSDLIKAYHRNIPGGVSGLFRQVLLLAMQEIPGNIIQSYAIEGKSPIYLDRVTVWNLGFSPIEASIFSKEGLHDRKVRHDPAAFATAVKVLWVAREHLGGQEDGRELILPPATFSPSGGRLVEVPCRRYQRIAALLEERGLGDDPRLLEVFWRHGEIPAAHLELWRGMVTVARQDWRRGQEWDNLYSFYNPEDGLIYMREDVAEDGRFELAFLVGLGQSLLGDYAWSKELRPLELEDDPVGKVYRLTLRPPAARRCYFSDQELERYLLLARMRRASGAGQRFTRVLNAGEGFTPPGLLLGLSYAWYLDNRLASHIEYKMAIAHATACDLIPEQIKNQRRRREMIDFLRSVVFRQG
ncbi:MAG: 2-phospho-L-lactate transferase CofD family protein [Desulfobacteraceae bacterium]|nr:2-phospho-L-lactate transferase CofD family protein [Desulfobacteraceae bacterium]